VLVAQARRQPDLRLERSNQVVVPVGRLLVHDLHGHLRSSEGQKAGRGRTRSPVSLFLASLTTAVAPSPSFRTSSYRAANFASVGASSVPAGSARGARRGGPS